MLSVWLGRLVGWTRSGPTRSVEMKERERSAAEPNAFMDSALEYAARAGWWVLPLKPHGKEPLTNHGYLDATTDRKQITEWWQRWPEANVGVCTGQRSDLTVLDVDSSQGEMALIGADIEDDVAFPDQGQVDFFLQTSSAGPVEDFSVKLRVTGEETIEAPAQVVREVFDHGGQSVVSGPWSLVPQSLVPITADGDCW